MSKGVQERGLWQHFTLLERELLGLLPASVQSLSMVPFSSPHGQGNHLGCMRRALPWDSETQVLPPTCCVMLGNSLALSEVTSSSAEVFSALTS